VRQLLFYYYLRITLDILQLSAKFSYVFVKTLAEHFDVVVPVRQGFVDTVENGVEGWDHGLQCTTFK